MEDLRVDQNPYKGLSACFVRNISSSFCFIYRITSTIWKNEIQSSNTVTRREI